MRALLTPACWAMSATVTASKPRSAKSWVADFSKASLVAAASWPRLRRLPGRFPARAATFLAIVGPSKELYHRLKRLFNVCQGLVNPRPEDQSGTPWTAAGGAPAGGRSRPEWTRTGYRNYSPGTWSRMEGKTSRTGRV